jgi:hypothetical protein
MVEDSLKSELVGLERRYWDALKDRDKAAALELTADPCIVTGAQGVAKLDRRSFASMMDAGGWTLKNYDLKDIEVQRLGDDVAIVGYKVREELEVDGQSVTLEAADASTWVRKGESWVCALHTESVLGDPYGRDRQSQPAA